MTTVYGRLLSFEEAVSNLRPDADTRIREALADGHLELWERPDGELVVTITELGRAFAEANRLD